jgi:hypothetical protein
MKIDLKLRKIYLLVEIAFLNCVEHDERELLGDEELS